MMPQVQSKESTANLNDNANSLVPLSPFPLPCVYLHPTSACVNGETISVAELALQRKMFKNSNSQLLLWGISNRIGHPNQIADCDTGRHTLYHSQHYRLCLLTFIFRPLSFYLSLAFSLVISYLLLLLFLQWQIILSLSFSLQQLLKHQQ